MFFNGDLTYHLASSSSKQVIKGIQREKIKFVSIYEEASQAETCSL